MDENKTLVHCNIVDCLYNTHCKCSAKEIEIDINPDDEGISRVECRIYKPEC